MPHISQSINAIKAHTKPKQTSLPQQRNEAFLLKWLNLQTKNHPKLQELESVFQNLCSNIWANPTQGQLIVLAGPSATGKSYFSRAISSWIKSVGHKKQWFKGNHLHYLQSHFIYWPKFLDNLKSGQWDLIEEILPTPVLILDDIGSAHDPSELGTDKLCQILSKREFQWTILSTNIPPTLWPDKLDRRIASRLLRNSLIVDLSDVPDFNA